MSEEPFARANSIGGERDLDVLIASMTATRRDGEYVFVSVNDDQLAKLSAVPGATHHALIREPEGVTLVLERADADAAGVGYDYVAAWITLAVHSSLAAVGLTAAVSQALADEGISCNVIAGYFHDHLLVPTDRADDALAALDRLSAAGC